MTEERNANYLKRFKKLQKDRPYLTEVEAYKILDNVDHAKRLGADGPIGLANALVMSQRQRKELEETVLNLKKERAALKRRITRLEKSLR